jgi:hypothetical protein
LGLTAASDPRELDLGLATPSDPRALGAGLARALGLATTPDPWVIFVILIIIPIVIFIIQIIIFLILIIILNLLGPSSYSF